MDDLMVSLTQNDKEGLLQCVQQEKLDELINQLKTEHDISLVFEVCKLGYTDILEAIVSSVGIDILDMDFKEPLVLTACRYNQPDMLKLLLYRGLPILPEGVQAWQEQSPLYVASRHGFLDIAQILLDTKPALLKDPDVRSCLLYAACLGGHIQLVKMWMLPSMDLNQPLSLVDSLDDCENKTPLYAACTGGHEEVINFLIGACLDLEFTKDVCNMFPEIIGKFLKTSFVPVSNKKMTVGSSSALSTTAFDDDDDDADDLFQLYVGNLQQQHLHSLPGSWLMPYCVTLVELDISDNAISELPDCLPWSFQNLRSFTAMRNKIKCLAPPTSPPTDGEEVCPSLEHLNLSYNKLEKVCREIFNISALTNVNLSHNCLTYLSKNFHQRGELQENQHSILCRQSSGFLPWQCRNLKTLDVSHNQLVMLPEDLKACTNLIQLIADDNCLITFPQPWDCPLQLLRLSHNKLERFPVNTEQYWCGSLKMLNISHNQLDEINEGIVKLSVLTELNASSNHIERLPPTEVWECSQLYHLDLRHNHLGLPRESSPKHNILTFSVAKLKSRSSAVLDTRLVQFPEVLEGCLKELRLADNNLATVPLSVCNLRQLEILDLSDNTLIKNLPKEIGKLRNLGRLKLDTLKLDNVPLEMYTGKTNKTKEIVLMFTDILRDCKPYSRIKTVVIGKKDKGKTTLVSLLAGRKSPKEEESKSIEREIITFTKRKDSFSMFSSEKKTEIMLNIWDMTGDDAYTMIYHSMFTPHSLYLIVWDFWSIESELDKIGQLIYNIQATTSSFRAIIVGTFFDKKTVKSDDKGRVISSLQETITSKFHTQEPIMLCAVSCITQEGITNLKDVMYATAISMKSGRRGRPLLEQKVPNSYLVLETVIWEKLRTLEAAGEPPCLTHTEFNDLIENIPVKENDLISQEEVVAVTKFLNQTGTLLHFSDQLGSLNTLYFLDPAWLSDVLVHVIISKDGRALLKAGTGKIKKEDVTKIYERDPRFPPQYISQYMELLERFEIAVSISRAGRMFFPCQLPESPPMNESSHNTQAGMKTIQRLYKMAECPSGFWTRLLTRMMTLVERFAVSDWFFKPSITQSFRKMELGAGLTEPQHLREKSVHGLHLMNPTKTFCREWIYVQHKTGSFCIEPFTGLDQTGGEPQKGVLITETSSTENFGIMGMITDEIEDIIQDFYPGLLEIDEFTMMNRLVRYALCPTCYHDNLITTNINHFTMEHCARMLVQGPGITCPQGVRHELQCLVPDLLMKELPAKFFLDPAELNVTESQETFLGGGVMGSVFKAMYKEQYVAVKVYRSDIRNKRGAGRFSQLSNGSDSGTATMSTQGSVAGGDPTDAKDSEVIYGNMNFGKMSQIDLDEGESIKALRAIREMRQEVALTSRLQHPCIVSLIGITFSPKLMMALELAPLGSLQSLLEKKVADCPPFDKYRHKDVVYGPLFSKELTYKFVYQMAKGLAYLHSNGIIYKDLKSDNILVMSEDLSAPVNLKLSDYGVSKYCWSGRSVGMVGTPGYQAPEILDGLAYDEKVDIFSFAMVIYEVFTGRRPFIEYESMAQISKAVKAEGKRPNISDFNVKTHFPYLDALMSQCWHKQASERPSATTIVSKRCMTSLQFVSQRAPLATPTADWFKTDCVFSVSDTGQCPLLWMWEGQDAERRCSVYDLEGSKFRVRALRQPGAKVTCTVKVDKHFWVGTENKEIEIYGQDKQGQPLVLFDRCSVDAMPVQIIAIQPSQGSYSARRSTDIYVALDDGKILMYQTQAGRQDVQMRRVTLKKVDGYTTPKQVVLRTDTLLCLAHTDKTNELWVSSSGFIDIISSVDFKVKKEERLAIESLNRMCCISPLLSISQLESSRYGQMFGLLCDSPYIYEFDVATYTCVSVLTLDKHDLQGASVLKMLDIDQDAYKGSADGISDLTVSSSDHPPTTQPYSEQRVLKRRTGWTNRSVVQGRGVSQRDLPVTIEGDSPTSPSMASWTVVDHEVPSSQVDDEGADNQADISGDSNDQVDESDDEAHSDVSRQKARKFFGEEIPPVIPPRTYKNKTLPDIPPRRSVMFLSSKAAMRKQSSFSLPNMKYTMEEFDTTVTSIAMVDDALWVGRSHGDIRLVDIRRSTVKENENLGKIIGIMKRFNHDKYDKEEGGVKLLSVGKFVASAHWLGAKDVGNAEEASTVVEIASWDSYNTGEVTRFNSYWSAVMRIEKELAMKGQVEKDQETYIETPELIVYNKGDTENF